MMPFVRGAFLTGLVSLGSGIGLVFFGGGSWLAMTTRTSRIGERFPRILALGLVAAFVCLLDRVCALTVGATLMRPRIVAIPIAATPAAAPRLRYNPNV